MQIRSSIQANISYSQNLKTTKQEQKDSIIDKNMNAKQISNAYFLEYSKQISAQSSQSINAQGALFEASNNKFPENLMDILKDIDLGLLGYEGKELTKLSKDEASELVSENGFFGIAKTSERIANFVLSGAGDDVAKLKAGREGILKGFNEAQKAWGGELPEISKKTIEKSLESIDKRLAELGETKLNIKA